AVGARARHGADRPGKAVVGRYGNALFRAARGVRHVSGPVGGDADVAVEAAALREVVDGNAGAEGQAAVVAARADRGRDALRAVVDRVRPGGEGRLRNRVLAAAERLVIRAGRRAAALGRDPGRAVVLGVRGRAAGAVQ